MSSSRAFISTLSKGFFDFLVLVCGCGSVAAGLQDGPDGNTYSLSSNTRLIELQQGSELSRKMSALQGGGYESAQGAWTSFRPWYQRRHGWADASITFMTQLTPEWSLVWGGSTGERGAKYRISPSLKIGLVFTRQIHKNSVLSIEATNIFGGQLKEKSCIADYGDIGGQQEVNCRLAASTLEPAHTLHYLFDEKPPMRHRLLIRYTRSF